jgi:hypothetical protein
MDIYGNNFLISIALKASSPSEAARVAQYCGCSKEQVRGVRNAAKFKRDEGVDAFVEKYTPFEEVDVEQPQTVVMVFTPTIDRAYESRPVNTAEWNQIADRIEADLAKLGVSVTIPRQHKSPYVKSTL